MGTFLITIMLPEKILKTYKYLTVGLHTILPYELQKYFYLFINMSLSILIL